MPVTASWHSLYLQNDRQGHSFIFAMLDKFSKAPVVLQHDTLGWWKQENYHSWSQECRCLYCNFKFYLKFSLTPFLVKQQWYQTPFLDHLSCSRHCAKHFLKSAHWMYYYFSRNHHFTNSEKVWEWFISCSKWQPSKVISQLAGTIVEPESQFRFISLQCHLFDCVVYTAFKVLS